MPWLRFGSNLRDSREEAPLEQAGICGIPQSL
jgi:hypothetical protein